MSACLPILVDGVHGRYGWVPVDHDAEKYVVASLPCTGQMVSKLIGQDTSPSQVRSFLGQNLRKHPLFAFRGTTDKERFCAIMNLTPFKVYKMTKKWASTNASNYIIMERAYFAGFMEMAKNLCTDRPMRLPCAKELSLGVSLMTNRISTTTCGRGSVTTDEDCTVLYENMCGHNEYISYEQRAKMPAMLFTLWEEGYGSGFREYFGMTPVDGKLGHVIDGVFVTPPACASVRRSRPCCRASRGPTNRPSPI